MKGDFHILMSKWQDPKSMDSFEKNKELLSKTKNQLHQNIESTMMRGLLRHLLLGVFLFPTLNVVI